MAMNALLPFCKGIIDGLTVPGGVGTISAWVTPPTVQTMKDPIAYVMAPTMVGDRTTAPRGAGFLECRWDVGIEITFETNPNVTNLDQQWALIVDAILLAYLRTPMPVQIIDATTGDKSSIVAIGEHVELENPAVVTPANQRMLLYRALMTIQVKEWLQR